MRNHSWSLALVLAATTALFGLCSAGGWGYAACSESKRNTMLEIVRDCPFKPFTSKASKVGRASDAKCPEGCFCSGVGKSVVQLGTKKKCFPVMFGANGTVVAANPDCKASSDCSCLPDACNYSCPDIDGSSCESQLDRDQDERNVIKKFFTRRNIIYFGLGGGGFLLLVLLACCLCCLICKRRRKDEE